MRVCSRKCLTRWRGGGGLVSGRGDDVDGGCLMGGVLRFSISFRVTLLLHSARPARAFSDA
jgi:hypothetical protein